MLEGEILDLLLPCAITDLDHAGRLLAFNSERHLRSAKEMTALFKDVYGAVELSARLQSELGDLGYEFPLYPAPEGETMDTFLCKRVEEGIARRYGPKRDRGLLERATKQHPGTGTGTHTY